MPSDCATVSALITSSAGSASRSSRIPVGVLEHLERGRGAERQQPIRLGVLLVDDGAREVGSWLPIIWSPQAISCGASSWGTVKIEQRNRIGSSREISETKSNSSRSSARSRTPRATSRMKSS